MKITRKQLRQIIKEEVSLLSETEMTQEKLNKVLDHLEKARDHVRSKDFFKADREFRKATEISVGHGQDSAGINNRDADEALEDIDRAEEMARADLQRYQPRR